MTFTLNKQFLMLKSGVGPMEHIKAKCHMIFSSSVVYMKQLVKCSNHKVIKHPQL